VCVCVSEKVDIQRLFHAPEQDEQATSLSPLNSRRNMVRREGAKRLRKYVYSMLLKFTI